MKKVLLSILSAVLVTVILVVTAVYTKQGFVIINEGSVGVKKSGTNYVPEPLTAGYHFFIPIYTTIDVVNIQPRLINYSVTEASRKDSDLLMFETTLKGLDRKGVPIELAVSIEVRPIEKYLPRMFAQEGGFDEGFYKKVLQPNRDAVQNTLGHFEADTIMDKRSEVALVLTKNLHESYGNDKNPYFKLEDVNLKDIVLPENIRAKQLDVASAKQLVEKAKHEADAEREKARGKADAVKIVSQGKADAITIEATAQANANSMINSSITPQVLSYRTIERWDGRKSLIQGSNSQMMLDLAEIQKLSAQSTGK